MEKLINLCVEYLHIALPYKIEFEKSKPTKKVSALHWVDTNDKGRLVHVIRIYMPMNCAIRGNMNTLIAHEFIHAWQAENGIEGAHGPDFQLKAYFLEKYLQGHGITVENIYSPELDIN